MDISVFGTNDKDKINLKMWADIVIEKWEQNLASKNLIGTGALINSFEAHVNIEASGNSALITFAYLYYVRMIDMGVGKGTGLHNRSEKKEHRKIFGIQTGNRRKPIPVYNKTFYSELSVLNRLLSEKFGFAAVIMMKNELMEKLD